MTPSTTHLVLIPSYNTGEKVYQTVRAAREQWAPVWVVVDGSTDGTGKGLQAMAAAGPAIARDGAAAQPGQGRGGAARFARGGARRLHPCADHGLRRPASGREDPGVHGRPRMANPDALVLGVPVFDASAPLHCACADARCPTGGPISKRCGRVSAIRCMASASTRRTCCWG